MTIQSSLDYQTKFFTDFAKAWADHSTFRLYQGIDTTAENLRLELSDAPGTSSPTTNPPSASWPTFWPAT